MKNRIVVIGAAISGVGAAVLAKKKGFEVFVSDILEGVEMPFGRMSVFIAGNIEAYNALVSEGD